MLKVRKDNFRVEIKPVGILGLSASDHEGNAKILIKECENMAVEIAKHVPTGEILIKCDIHLTCSFCGKESKLDAYGFSNCCFDAIKDNMKSFISVQNNNNNEKSTIN